MTTTKLQEQAKKFSAFFEQKARGDDTIWTIKDGAPPEVQEMAHHAHGDMMPDDWRYEFIVSALDALAESEDPDDIALEPDIYTGEFMAWLGSRADRYSYVDEVRDDLGAESFASITDEVQAGQLREKEEVLGLVRSWLEENADLETCDDCGNHVNDCECPDRDAK